MQKKQRNERRVGRDSAGKKREKQNFAKPFARGGVRKKVGTKETPFPGGDDSPLDSTGRMNQLLRRFEVLRSSSVKQGVKWLLVRDPLNETRRNDKQQTPKRTPGESGQEFRCGRVRDAHYSAQL